VGLFFSGRPVYGSKGVLADFAGKALDCFQDLISKHFATMEVGQLGTRGPIPIRPETQLMVTDVARGSFGFVLEEAAANEQLVDTVLARAVDDVAELVTRLASADPSAFEEAVEGLEQRVLGSAKNFFRTLDDAGAAIRIVEGDRDHSLTYADVQRARHRTDEMQIQEHGDVELRGRLVGLMPIHRRFEFHRDDTGEIISGTVSKDAGLAYVGGAQQSFDNPLNANWRALFRVREVTSRARKPKSFFTLLKLIELIR